MRDSVCVCEREGKTTGGIIAALVSWRSWRLSQGSFGGCVIRHGGWGGESRLCQTVRPAAARRD